MTAAEVARHFNARRVGRGRWTALCPVHGDRKPSLAIKEGHSAVLVSCMSHQCDLGDIVRAASLTMDQLFYHSRVKLDPKAYVALQRKQRADEIRAQTERRQIRFWTDETRKWETVSCLLMAHMIHSEDDRITRLWHRAIATARERHRRLKEHWPRAPEVTCDPLVRVPREITRVYVGDAIAEVLGL